MATLKYRAKNGTIKTLGLVSTGSAVTSVNGKTGAVTGLYDSDNPPPYPVTSVNGKTGYVTGLYDSANPPPYPVTSVNGKTGAVTGLYDSANPPPYPVKSVNGKTGAVTINIPVIKTAVLTFTFSGEDASHICITSIVNNTNKVLDIIPYTPKLFRGGIEYNNGYLFTAFMDQDAEVYTDPVECRVLYYE